MENKEAWKVRSINIQFQDWGDYKNKYVGKIVFDNKEQEAFTFNLRPEMCEEYLRLISSEVGVAATELSQRIVTSLNLLTAPPAAPPMIEIKAT